MAGFPQHSMLHSFRTASHHLSFSSFQQIVILTVASHSTFTAVPHCVKSVSGNNEKQADRPHRWALSDASQQWQRALLLFSRHPTACCATISVPCTTTSPFPAPLCAMSVLSVTAVSLIATSSRRLVTSSHVLTRRPWVLTLSSCR